MTSDKPECGIIYEEHHRRIYQLCYRMTRNHADAAEITQEIFIEVFDNLAKFRGEASLGTWIYAIGRRVCHKRRAKNDLRREAPIDERDDKAVESRIVEMILIKELLGKLPAKDREMVAYSACGFTPDEIGREMGVTAANVIATVYRSRMRLRRWWGRPITRYKPRKARIAV